MKNQILIHQPSEEPLIINGADRELRNEVEMISKMRIEVANSELKAEKAMAKLKMIDIEVKQLHKT